MASKRHVRQKQCGTKKRFATQTAAWADLKHLLRMKGEQGTMHTYYCSWCRWWHHGHTSKALMTKE